jgi:DeoR/GlpR family transcriptional regulator of sugar metabolism
LGATGITEDGMSNSEVNAAAVYTAMMGCAVRTTVVADRTKFGLRALKLYGAWGKSVELVCDQPPPEQIAAGIARTGARVIVAPTSADRQ